MGSENEEVKRLREKLKLTKEKLRACKAERDFLAQENEQLKEKLMQIHSLSYVSELMLSPRTSSEVILQIILFDCVPKICILLSNDARHVES